MSAEVKATDAYKIMMQFKTPASVCISVKGEYWERLPALHGQRLSGTITRWTRRGETISATWPDGADTEHLCDILHPEVDLQFEPYENGRPAPRLSGRAAHRAATEREAEEEREQVSISYMDGAVEKTQTWTVLDPQAVTVDQRTEPWVKPTLNRQLSTLRSPYKMFFGAALPMQLVASLSR